MKESGERPDVEKRKTLGRLVGIGAAAAGAVLGMAGGAKSAEAGPKQTELKESPEQLKDRNTTIEIEKAILNAFNSVEIGQIGTGVIPDKVSTLSRGYELSVTRASIAATATVGAVALAAKDYFGNKEDNDQLIKEALAGSIGVLVTALCVGDVYSRPSIKNVKNAEEEVVAWIQRFNLEKQLTKKELAEGQRTSNDTVVDAIKVQIGRLTKEQADNTKKISPRNAG